MLRANFCFSNYHIFPPARWIQLTLGPTHTWPCGLELHTEKNACPASEGPTKGRLRRSYHGEVTSRHPSTAPLLAACNRGYFFYLTSAVFALALQTGCFSAQVGARLGARRTLVHGGVAHPMRTSIDWPAQFPACRCREAASISPCAADGAVGLRGKAPD